LNLHVQKTNGGDSGYPYGSGGATGLLLRDRGIKELYGTQQLGHAPMSEPEVKNGNIVPKMARRKGSNEGQFRR